MNKLTLALCAGLSLGVLGAAFAQDDLPPAPPRLGPAPAPNAPGVPNAAPAPHFQAAPDIPGAGAAPTAITIDAGAGRHLISPLIYGVRLRLRRSALGPERHPQPQRRQRRDALQLEAERLQPRQRLFL